METAFRAPTRLIALENKRGPPTRVFPPHPRMNDHPAKRTSRQPLHALALMCPCLGPHKDVRDRGEDIVLRRHERDRLCAVLCEGVARMYESRLDDLLSAVRRGQAVLRDARGESAAAGRARGRQKGDVKPRVEASVCVCVRAGVRDRRRVWYAVRTEGNRAA